MQAYYKPVALIGQGTYGNVYKCRIQLDHTQWDQDDGVVAVKKFRKAGAGVDWQRGGRGSKCHRELAMVQLLSGNPGCVHIVKLLDHFFTKGGKLCLVFEHIDKTLLQVIQQHPRGMNEKSAKRLVWQLLLGVKELHDRNIMHRDLKPENVLVDKHGVVRLCDFGFARHCPVPYGNLSGCQADQGKVMASPAQEGDDESEEMTRYVSTRWYRAPELLLRCSSYDTSIDVWAIGCLVIELLTGRPAFAGDTDLHVLSSIISCMGETPPAFQDMKNILVAQAKKRLVSMDGDTMRLKSWLETSPSHARDFVKRCLAVHPNDRATVDTLLEHAWFMADRKGWDTPDFTSSIEGAMSRTQSIEALTLACKRLRTATAKQAPHRRRQSLKETSGRYCAKQSPSSSLMSHEAKNLIKHAYYTPQVQQKDITRAREETPSVSQVLDTPGGLPSQPWTLAQRTPKPLNIPLSSLHSPIKPDVHNLGDTPNPPGPGDDQQQIRHGKSTSSSLSKLGNIFQKFFK